MSEPLTLTVHADTAQAEANLKKFGQSSVEQASVVGKAWADSTGAAIKSTDGWLLHMQANVKSGISQFDLLKQAGSTTLAQLSKDATQSTQAIAQAGTSLGAVLQRLAPVERTVLTGLSQSLLEAGVNAKQFMSAWAQAPVLEKASLVLTGVGSAVQGMGRNIIEATPGVKALDGALEEFGLSLGKIATIAGGVAIFAAMATGIKEAIEVEKALLNVSQALQVAGQSAEVAKVGMHDIGESLDEISGATGIASTALVDVAVAATKLGVTGTEEVKKFTKTIADLSLVTGVNVKLLSDQIAELSLQLGLAPDKAENLASALTKVAPPGTAAEILSMTTAVAGMGKATGLAAADIVGFSTAIKLLGGTGLQVNQFLNTFSKAVADDGTQLLLFAQVTGIATDKIKQLIAAGQGREVLTAFFKGLNEAGSRSTAILEALGLSGAKSVTLFRNLGTAWEMLGKKIADANQGFEEAVDLQNKTAEVLALTATQIARLGAVISNSLAKAFEDSLLVIQPVVKLLADFFETLKSDYPLILKIAGDLTLAAAGFTAIGLALGGLVLAIGGAISGFGALFGILGLIFSPTGLVILGVGALVAGLVLLEQQTGWLSSAWVAVKDSIVAAGEALTYFFPTQASAQGLSPQDLQRHMAGIQSGIAPETVMTPSQMIAIRDRGLTTESLTFTGAGFTGAGAGSSGTDVANAQKKYDIAKEMTPLLHSQIEEIQNAAKEQQAWDNFIIKSAVDFGALTQVEGIDAQIKALEVESTKLTELKDKQIALAQFTGDKATITANVKKAVDAEKAGQEQILREQAAFNDKKAQLYRQDMKVFESFIDKMVEDQDKFNREIGALDLGPVGKQLQGLEDSFTDYSDKISGELVDTVAKITQTGAADAEEKIAEANAQANAAIETARQKLIRSTQELAQADFKKINQDIAELAAGFGKVGYEAALAVAIVKVGGVNADGSAKSWNDLSQAEKDQALATAKANQNMLQLKDTLDLSIEKDKQYTALIRAGVDARKAARDAEYGAFVETEKKKLDAQIRNNDIQINGERDLLKQKAVILAQEGQMESDFGKFLVGTTRQYLLQMDNLWQGFAKMLTGLFDSMQRSLSDFFFDFFNSGTFNVKKLWQSMLDTMKRSLADFLATQAVKGFLSLLFGTETSGQPSPTLSSSGGGIVSSLLGGGSGGSSGGLLGTAIGGLSKVFGLDLGKLNLSNVFQNLFSGPGGFSPTAFQNPMMAPGVAGEAGPPEISWDTGAASGGPVPGFGSGDRVPAMLEPGEYVVRKDIAAQIAPALDVAHGHPRPFGRGGVMMMATGGQVSLAGLSGTSINQLGTVGGFSAGDIAVIALLVQMLAAQQQTAQATAATAQSTQQTADVVSNAASPAGASSVTAAAGGSGSAGGGGGSGLSALGLTGSGLSVISLLNNLSGGGLSNMLGLGAGDAAAGGGAAGGGLGGALGAASLALTIANLAQGGKMNVGSGLGLASSVASLGGLFAPGGSTLIGTAGTGALAGSFPSVAATLGPDTLNVLGAAAPYLAGATLAYSLGTAISGIASGNPNARDSGIGTLAGAAAGAGLAVAGAELGILAGSWAGPLGWIVGAGLGAGIGGILGSVLGSKGLPPYYGRRREWWDRANTHYTDWQGSLVKAGNESLTDIKNVLGQTLHQDGDDQSHGSLQMGVSLNLPTNVANAIGVPTQTTFDALTDEQFLKLIKVYQEWGQFAGGGTDWFNAMAQVPYLGGDVVAPIMTGMKETAQAVLGALASSLDLSKMAPVLPPNWQQVGPYEIAPEIFGGTPSDPGATFAALKAQILTGDYDPLTPQEIQSLRDTWAQNPSWTDSGQPGSVVDHLSRVVQLPLSFMKAPGSEIADNLLLYRDWQAGKFAFDQQYAQSLAAADPGGGSGDAGGFMLGGLVGGSNSGICAIKIGGHSICDLVTSGQLSGLPIAGVGSSDALMSRDTVHAMLEPGEFVVPRRLASENKTNLARFVASGTWSPGQSQMSGSGPISITIVVNGNMDDPHEFVQRVTPMLRDELKRIDPRYSRAGNKTQI